MKFVSTEMLFLLWLVPAILFLFLYGMRKRREILSRFSTARGLGVAASGISDAGRWTKVFLILVVVIFLSLALSGPQYGFRWQNLEQRGIDIIIALDCSRSMLAEDISPSRLDRAKREIYDLLGMLKGDRVGLVAFAGTAFLQCPLTLDYEAFHIFLNALSPDFLPLGGTDIAAALSEALAGFSLEHDTDKAVILITDGEDTGAGNPVDIAESARKSAVKIFCVGIGRSEGAPIPDAAGGFRKDGAGNIVLSRLDEATLKKIAELTGGAYVRSVAGDMDLETIYSRKIRKEMEATTQESGRKKVWEDRFQWFLALAILALLIDLAVPETKRGTVLLIMAVLLLCRQPVVWAGEAGNMVYGGSEAYERGEYEKALKSFIDAQLEDPERPEIFYDIGNAYYRLGNFDAAAENYRAALKGGADGLRQKAQYNLGNASYRKGELEAAITHYEEALRIDPGDEEARNNLDFVKKKRAEQRQENQESQQQESRGDGERGDRDAQEHENGGEKGPSEKGQGEAPKEDESPSSGDSASPRYGSEMDDDGEEHGEKTPQPGGDDTPAQQHAAGGEGKAGDQGGSMQAERILNRLHDQPGKATMPFYEKRTVEKDW